MTKRKDRLTKQAHIYYNEREFNQLGELQEMTEKYLNVAPSKSEMFRLSMNWLYRQTRENPEVIKELLIADIRED